MKYFNLTKEQEGQFIANWYSFKYVKLANMHGAGIAQVMLVIDIVTPEGSYISETR